MVSFAKEILPHWSREEDRGMELKEIEENAFEGLKLECLKGLVKERSEGFYFFVGQSARDS